MLAKQVDREGSMSGEKSVAVIDLSKTIVSIDDDGKKKESFYVPILDDPDDDFENLVVRRDTRSQTKEAQEKAKAKEKRANQPSIMIDLSVDDEDEVPRQVNRVQDGVRDIRIISDSGMSHSHSFLIVSNKKNRRSIS